MATFSDMSIASVLCFYLLKSRSRYYEGTDCILKLLVRYTLNTGLLATFWSIGSVISFGLKPRTEISLIFYLPLSEVYVNAFLASLNARKSLREKSRIATHRDGQVTDLNGTRLRSITFASRGSQQMTGAVEAEEDVSNVMAIQVRVDTESASDGFPHNLEKARFG